MPFWFDGPRLVDASLLGARALAPVDGAGEQAAHRGEANPRRGGDVAVAEILRAKREQKAIARRQPLERVPQHLYAAVFVEQAWWCDGPLVMPDPTAPIASAAAGGRATHWRRQ